MRKFIVAGVLTVAVVLLCTAVQGAKYTVPLTNDDITRYAAAQEALGEYFVAPLRIPEVLTGAELYGAYLEVYLDVDAVARGELTNPAPNFEVHLLADDFAGSLDPAKLGLRAWGPVNIAAGTGRRLVIDITAIVRFCMEDPSRNHGLIMGALTGDRDGVFTLRADLAGDKEPARVIYHYGHGPR